MVEKCTVCTNRGFAFLQAAAGAASDAAAKFVDAIESCSGRVLVTGIGKSGCVARRMSVSLMSTGTLAHFVHVRTDAALMRNGAALSSA
jgi:D-arabinose 5-phosphate isomerase GutQ